MTTDELIQYYVNLLVIEYKTLPNATATIQLLVTDVVADQIYNSVLNGFNISSTLNTLYGLSTAIGAQLDVVGEYVGAQRALFGFSPTGVYMSFIPYSTSPVPANVGFAQYSDAAPSVDFWLSYSASSGATYTLTDGQMLQLINYYIALHACDHTNYSIDQIIAQFFAPYLSLTDNGNMTITYTHNTADPNILFNIVGFNNALPRPAGVNVLIVEI